MKTITTPIIPMHQDGIRLAYSAAATLSTKVCFALLVFLFCFSRVDAQVFPTGFSQVLVANGISNPTVMAFAPDGRIFVAQQNGQLRVIKNGLLLAQPFITLSVNSSGERGLLGIAFDPAFSSNQFIYLYYTLSNAANNRISRFTASNDTVVPGSEVLVLNLDPLSSATNHNGGTIEFGLDGKLYVGVGENANSANSQNLDTYLGKILRINSDGSVPAGNPFTTGSAQRQRVWEYGMRNPWTLSVQPGTGNIFVNDVGQNTWEEVNDCSTGGLNYGWPNAEGMSTNPAYTNPVYTYMHGTGLGLGCAITGGTFFNPASTNYPSMYVGKYFFLDYCGNWIDQLTFNGSTWSRSNFASAISGSPVGIITGTDGNLYFLSRDNSGVYKIIFSSGSAPVITQHPQTQTISQGNPVTFSVTATGTAPLNYQWRKNTVNISGATNSSYTITSVVSGDAGNYSVVVSNTSGTATSNNATLTVTAPNQSPDATINTPLVGDTYAGGDVINFSGSGTDTEDITIPASGFTWWVNFHHDTHIHPGPTVPSGVTSGTFTIPNIGETSANVFYRLYLVVTDSQGARDTSFRDILPRTSLITINTNPTGLQITLDGQPFTAPLTVTSVEGILRTIGATSPQTSGSTSYSFNSWNEGGPQTQTFATPVNDASYTARFNLVISPLADAYVRAGSGNNSNFGMANVLSTKNAGATSSKTNETYIKFNITSFTANITSAKLRLFGKITSGNVSTIAVEVHDVTNLTWVENTITNANKPAATTTVLASVNVTGMNGSYFEWDITSYIIAKKNAGNTTVSLFLKNTNPSAGNSRVDFNSREAASNKPQLAVLPSLAPRLESMISDNGISSLIKIYPNPAKGFFTIEVTESLLNTVMRIYDVSGRMVMETIVSSFTQEINITGLRSGLYIIRTGNGANGFAKKLLIE